MWLGNEQDIKTTVCRYQRRMTSRDNGDKVEGPQKKV